jgi:Putative zinc-finger
MSGCEYAELDGSYVLGGLSPAERQEYEKHLATCADCATSVREMAGLPGLLARVDPVILEPAPAAEPVPATLLPSLVREVGRARRRRRLTVLGTAVAAAVAVGVIVVSSLGQDEAPPAATPPATSPSASTAAPVGQSMMPVGHVPVTATLAVTRVGWGTKLDLTCSYRSEGEGYQLPKTVTYGLFVVNRDGSAEQVGTWQAIDGKTMHFSAGTAAQGRDIKDVEVRTADGHPVLRLQS